MLHANPDVDDALEMPFQSSRSNLSVYLLGQLLDKICQNPTQYHPVGQQTVIAMVLGTSLLKANKADVLERQRSEVGRWLHIPYPASNFNWNELSILASLHSTAIS